MVAQDQSASIGIFIRNAQAGDVCLMEVTATGAGNLF
jgi:hypothetical protein